MGRIDAIEPFRVMQLLERARTLEAQGRDIVHMEIGEPDFSPPGCVAAAAHQALDSGAVGYTPSTGLPALQEALSDWYRRQHNLKVAPQRILITPGASGAFLVLYLVLLEAGQRVLLPDPGYPCQRNFVRLAGGEPISLPVGPESGYHLAPSHLRAHWDEQTRLALVTSPGNPTGTVLKADALARLAAAVRERDGVLIADEIYHGLSYTQAPPCALELDPDVIVVNGFSKRWAMTGWRVGWMVVPEALIDPCRRVMQNVFIAAATLSQHAALAALTGDSAPALARMVAAYDIRRRYLLAVLPKLGFVIPVVPEGAFYIYADASAHTQDAPAFCTRLLEQVGVAITPGADFGQHRANVHVRFAYANDLDRIKDGIARLAAFLNRPAP